MIVLRSLQSADLIAVTTLVQDLWPHNVVMQQIYHIHNVWESSPLNRHSLVAVQEEHVVGAGTLFENTVHPKRLLVVINVARTAQHRGIGTALYHALGAWDDGRAWQAKANRDDHVSMGFLAKQGFFPIMHTLTGHLLPASTDVQAWLQLLPAHITGVSFVSLTDPTAGVTREHFAHILARVYHRYHSWSPPATFSAEQAITLFTGTDFLAESAICVLKDGQLCGGSSAVC